METEINFQNRLPHIKLLHLGTVVSGFGAIGRPCVAPSPTASTPVTLLAVTELVRLFLQRSGHLGHRRAGTGGNLF